MLTDGKRKKKVVKYYHYSEVTEAEILSTCSTDFLKTKQKGHIPQGSFITPFSTKKEADLNLRYISNGNS